MASAADAGALVRKVVEVKGENRGDDLKDWLQRDDNTIQKWIERARDALAWTPDWKPSLWKGSIGLNEWDAGDDTDPIPPRGWLLGNVFCRRFPSSLIGDGGTGKSALRYAQALSLATNRQLTGEHVFQRCRVLIVSFEDGRDELRRRVSAAMQHHGVSRADVSLPDGTFFSDAPNAKETAAWRVVQNHAPRKPQAQCREVIKAWLKNEVLVACSYHNEKTRKDAKGLRVDDAKRPDAPM
jgi:AAA domain